MVLKCAIHLDDEEAFYTAGGMLSGQIVLSTTWSDKLHGIMVKLASKVEIDDDASRLSDPYRKSRNEDVSFHCDCQPMIINAEGEGKPSCLANLVSKRNIIITRGVIHRYPFLLKLPKELPCTFTGAYGHLSYKIVVFIRPPFREMYIGATKSIRVGPLLDLNDQSVHLQLPVQDERKYHLGGRSSGPEGEIVKMRIRLPRTAFVPGQQIPFEIEVINRSHLTVPGVTVNLNVNAYFQTDQTCKVDGRTLLRSVGPGIAPEGRELWRQSFCCPRVLPTGLGGGLGAGSIDLQYFLQFELRITEEVNLSSVFKIVVGTLSFSHYHLLPSAQVTVPVNPSRSRGPPSYDLHMMSKKHAETPPPTYEEALSMDSHSVVCLEGGCSCYQDYPTHPPKSTSR